MCYLRSILDYAFDCCFDAVVDDHCFYSIYFCSIYFGSIGFGRCPYLAFLIHGEDSLSNRMWHSHHWASKGP